MGAVGELAATDTVYRRVGESGGRVFLVLDASRTYVAREADVIAESCDAGVAFWEDGYRFTPTQGLDGGVLVVAGSIRETAWMREHPLFGMWARAIINNEPISPSVLARLLFGFNDTKETNPETVPAAQLVPVTKDCHEAWMHERVQYLKTFKYLD